MTNFIKILSFVFIALLISNCSGGGGSSSSSNEINDTNASENNSTVTPITVLACNTDFNNLAHKDLNISANVKSYQKLETNWTVENNASYDLCLTFDDGKQIGMEVNQSVSPFTYTFDRGLWKLNGAKVRIRSCVAGADCNIDEQNVSMDKNLTDGMVSIKASDSNLYGHFGGTLSMDENGTALVVGAYAANTTEANQAGTVYVYTRKNTEWNESQILKAPTPTTNAFFGASVALSSDGKTVAISEGNASKAYIFELEGATWNNTLNVDVDLNSTNAIALSAAGNIMAIADNNNSGELHIYTKESDTWSSTPNKIRAEEANSDIITADHFFGWSLAISGNGKTIAVGAIDKGNGAVYFFEYNDSSSAWTASANTIDKTGSVTDFGNSLALNYDGTILAVGDPLNANSGLNLGTVFIYDKNTTDFKWTLRQTIKAKNFEKGTLEFGQSVSFNKNATTLVVGASMDTTASTGIHEFDESNSSGGGGGGLIPGGSASVSVGAAYVFELNSNNQFEQKAYIKPKYHMNSSDSVRFGFSVFISANNEVIAVGAPYEDTNARGINATWTDEDLTDSGAVYIY